LLPLLGQSTERADAARNRRALLVAAHAILVKHGIDALSMDAVAAEAGVGTGTVYRRFTDRSGLAFALLDDTERRFQAAFMTGPAPLGPCAPPAVRIRAFMHAQLDRLETDAELLAMAAARSPVTRYTSAPYLTARLHLVGLLTAVGTSTDPGYLADALLALVQPGLFLYQRHSLHLGLARLKDRIDHLLAAVQLADPNCEDTDQVGI
jgi:AcrR family transcriptional regulator